MDIEKKKVIYQLNTNVSLMKFMLIFMLCASTICVGLYIPGLYTLRTENLTGVPTLVMGFYLIPLALNGVGFLKTWEKKQNNYNFYDIYTVVPVKREYIIQQEFKFWKYIPIFSGVLLLVTNILYFLNPALKEISGYFVFITVTNIILVVSDFFARFHRKKAAGLIKIIWVLMCSLCICFNVIESVNNAFIEFMRLDVFKHMAGIPMVVLSLLIVPFMFTLHYKYPYGKNRKSAAWY